MSNSSFHEESYDAGTLTKLQIFELYTQAWIPVFVSPPEPSFPEIHIYDFFCGPGTDASGVPGSPLRIMRQLRQYQQKNMAGWSMVKIFGHLSDADARKISQLTETLKSSEWKIPGVQIEIQTIAFSDALDLNRNILTNPRAAKLLIIDQFGVDEVTDHVFKRLATFPKTDFISFCPPPLCTGFGIIRQSRSRSGSRRIPTTFTAQLSTGFKNSHLLACSLGDSQSESGAISTA
jgi:three-Cys-motif partner protein